MDNMLDLFIQSHERVHGRKLRPYEAFLLRSFYQFLSSKNGHVLSVGSPRKIVGNSISIAFISEDIGHLTGGRYYTWFIACALVELGYDVTFYTNMKPAFYDYFKNYQMPKINLIDRAHMENLDVQADIYIGAPLRGNLAVTNLSKKYHKPSYCMIFDPLPLMKEYLGSAFSGWEKLVVQLRDSNVKIISLCDSTGESIPEWLNKKKEDVFPIFPCINSKELDSASKGERENYVVFVSRIVEHKRFNHVLRAVKENNINLKVITSTETDEAERLVNSMGLKGKVEFLQRIEDKEKFEVINRARAVIVGAIFEGFGMWAAEAVATGTPLVCYEFPSIREIKKISGAENFYMAKHDDPQSLSENLKVCLKEAKFEKRNESFDFAVLKGRVKELLKPSPRIGIVTICLNEQKFIGASLRSVLKHPNVKKIAVVEGAVNLFQHGANEKGLSKDNTEKVIYEVIKEDKEGKIIYEKYGWASNKSELRNRALTLLGEDVDYVLVVDSDEVWKQEDLTKLAEEMVQHPRVGAFFFDFYHFWKNKNMVAVGGQWNSQMFRCFKYENKELRWVNHGAPVVDKDNKFINITDGSFIIPDIHVYHYGYCKDEKDVQDKLLYYKKRDINLDVKDTWTDWKEGQPTQPTHGGGSAIAFEGSHPQEMAGIL